MKAEENKKLFVKPRSLSTVMLKCECSLSPERMANRVRIASN